MNKRLDQRLILHLVSIFFFRWIDSYYFGYHSVDMIYKLVVISNEFDHV